MSDERRTAQLREQGVVVPFPHLVAIGPEVVLENIVGPNTVLHPGCYLQGAALSVGPGCELGAEGPVTLKNCTLGERVALKGGYFEGAVCLQGANMGLGAHIRPGTLLEEEANGAHTVGLKQTILLPFVTLGSLINFCDILMAGGTSRQDHSEVGSSFIHFNFTPHGKHGDKATPSLIGDVPRGVMLRSRRIFLGGQAGLVGPMHVDYGTVLAAGAVYRQDRGPDQLVVGEALTPGVLPFTPLKLNKVADRVRRNLAYIGNLVALWQWYAHVRLPLADGDPQRLRVYRAGQSLLADAVAERLKQLGRLASYMQASIALLETATRQRPAELAAQRALLKAWPTIEGELKGFRHHAGDAALRTRFLEGLHEARRGDYLDTIRALSDEVAARGTAWLDGIVTEITQSQMRHFPIEA